MLPLMVVNVLDLADDIFALFSFAGFLAPILVADVVVEAVLLDPLLLDDVILDPLLVVLKYYELTL